MIDKQILREFNYKMNTIIEYLILSNGFDAHLYNRLRPDIANNSDTDIIDYAVDVIRLINNINKENSDFF
jgi:hypothetical protein